VSAAFDGWLREAQAAVRVAEAAYRFGERGILDVLDAQRVLRGVRADLLQARYQQQSARIALDQLSGQFAHDPQP
jgi:cobalt-zinc-cadmium efflux system outer membrane protein